MPIPDLPSPDQPPRPDRPGQRHPVLRRFWRIFRLLALFSIVIAVLAVYLVARGDEAVHVHMLVATALGIGLTVLLGTALMALAFLSASSGHDEKASHSRQKDTE